MNSSDLSNLGFFGLLILVLIALIIPFIITASVGVAFANIFGFTGIVWWAFIIFFYLVSCSIFAAWNR